MRPRLGMSRSWAASSRASGPNGESASFSRTVRRFTVDGYTVLSVLGYEMKPDWYRLSAMFIACAAPKPIRFASVTNIVVLKGGGGRSSRSFWMYSATVPWDAASAWAWAVWASLFAQYGPWTWSAAKSTGAPSTP